MILTAGDVYSGGHSKRQDSVIDQSLRLEPTTTTVVEGATHKRRGNVQRRQHGVMSSGVGPGGGCLTAIQLRRGDDYITERHVNP